MTVTQGTPVNLQFKRSLNPIQAYCFPGYTLLHFWKFCSAIRKIPNQLDHDNNKKVQHIEQRSDGMMESPSLGIFNTQLDGDVDNLTEVLVFYSSSDGVPRSFPT